MEAYRRSTSLCAIHSTTIVVQNLSDPCRTIRELLVHTSYCSCHRRHALFQFLSTQPETVKVYPASAVAVAHQPGHADHQKNAEVEARPPAKVSRRRVLPSTFSAPVFDAFPPGCCCGYRAVARRCWRNLFQ